ncbi:MAG: (Fe-S)-binding protein [Bacilli bacterium]|nr:(Fe-S)-binding protein [Bacilli bacterium]
MISIFSVYILPALILAGIGVVFGILIAVFNKYFYVEEDNRIEELTKLLPGYNCGSCGFPGCKGLAEAIVNNNDDLAKCKPLSSDQKIKAHEYIQTLKK